MKRQRPPEPRYSHLLEVLDGAASLRMAIRQAEEALMDPGLAGEDRQLLESVLQVSRERLERVAVALRQAGAEGIESPGLDDEAGWDWSEHDLMEAARAASAGSEEAEREAARAIDRLGRSLKLGARTCIEAFLSHPSSLLRASAIKVLALHWRLRDYTDRALWLLASDDEPDCRRAAALCLGSLYEGTRDPEIGRELVAALRREDEEQDVRWASYYALLELDGAGREPRPLPIDEFDPPHDADPELLARYGGAR